MNKVLETIKNRSSCRHFNDEVVSNNDLFLISKAALQAPSGMNKQPCKIVVINDKSIIDEMNYKSMEILENSKDKSYYNLIISRGGKQFYNAPCIIAVLVKGNKLLEAGMASQNIMLAAESLNLATVVVGSINIILNSENGKKYQDILQIDEEYALGCAILIGKTNDVSKSHQIKEENISFYKE